ncbi:hypothetical protein, partial [Pseudomonas sp. SHC52]
VRNELTEGWLRPCTECEAMTPHDKFNRCLTCVSSPLDDESISRIAMQAALLATARSSARGNSMFNAAALIRDFQFPDENEYLYAVDEFPDLFIATSVIEYRMRCNASTATKDEVVQWLREIFVLSDLGCSYEVLAGRAIGSLCAKKLMSKIDTGKYRLSDS